MDNKNIVINTRKASETIINILEKPEVDIYLTDGNKEVNILLDYDAINLLKAHYKSKLVWGNRITSNL